MDVAFSAGVGAEVPAAQAAQEDAVIPVTPVLMPVQIAVLRAAATVAVVAVPAAWAVPLAVVSAVRLYVQLAVRQSVIAVPMTATVLAVPAARTVPRAAITAEVPVLPGVVHVAAVPAVAVVRGVSAAAILAVPALAIVQAVRRVQGSVRQIVPVTVIPIVQGVPDVAVVVARAVKTAVLSSAAETVMETVPGSCSVRQKFRRREIL